MSITDRVRKSLWGRSGNRCAFCKAELVAEPTAQDDESIVGDECHIVSGKTNGPRYDPTVGEDQIDSAANLVLLCRVHHKMVDDQTQTYTVEVLQQLKAKHESWVKSKLTDHAAIPPVRIRSVPESKPTHLHRLTTGQEVLAIVCHAMAYGFDNDDLSNSDEVELIAEFCQEIQDWGERAEDLESGAMVRAKARVSEMLRELKSAGFWVFGAREIQRIEGGLTSPGDWPVAIIRVVRDSNSSIFKTTS